MIYKPKGSHISMEIVASWQVLHDGPTGADVANFCHTMTRRGFGPKASIPIDEEFIEYASKSSCFIKMLHEKGYIDEQEFSPINIRIDTLDEFIALYNRMNVNSGDHFNRVIDWEKKKDWPHSITFSQIARIAEERKLKVSIIAGDPV